MKVLVGSTNPVKVEAVKEAFYAYFKDVDVYGLKAKSGVPAQPRDEETFDGARNRALMLKDKEADFFVGIESGIIQLHKKWFAFGCIYVLNKEGREGYGTTPLFQLPDTVVERLLSKEELGDLIDELTGTEKTKQKKGAIGYFTKDIIDRKRYYMDGLLMALIPFINEELFPQK